MNSQKLAVVITGASTGIGQATAVQLARKDHQVFAGVRKKEDGEKLRKLEPKIIPVILDVASSDSLQKAFVEISSVRDKSRPFCLVNNAGIAVPGPVEALKMSEWRKQMDVNFFGVIETTQVFLPFIRETKGRIVNISSINGRMSTPFMGAYASSKFAVEAMSDALRIELAPFGVKVSVIQPGPIQTPIWSKGLENRGEMQEKCDKIRLPLYIRTYEKFEKLVQAVSNRAIPVENVSEQIERALTAKTPVARKIVAGARSHFETRLSEWLPESVFDKLVLKEISPD